MGFPSDYTLSALKSGASKADPGAGHEARASLLGNTMHIVNTSWLLSHLAVEWNYLSRVPSLEELWNDDADHLVVAPRQQANRSGGDHPRELTDGQRLCLWLMCHVDTRGSDVRITTGELFRPNRVARQHIDTRWWQWKTAAGWKWAKSSNHISELEARATLTELKRRTRTSRRMPRKYLHLLDGAVTIGLLTKKRSSSRVLQSVVRRLDALEAASG